MRLFLPKHDMAFQALFNNYERKNLLIDLINSILMPSGHKPIKDVVLLNPGLEVDFKDDKMPRLDVRAQSEDGTIHHIEIQLQHRTGMEERFFYYDCRLVANQLQSGSDYTKLKPVISIIINDFKEEHQVAPEYHLVESRWIAKPRAKIAKIRSRIGFETHLVQLRQLPAFLPENLLHYTPEQLWGFFLTLKGDEERRLLNNMGETYKQANTAWKQVSQDKKLKQQQWDLETRRTDYLIDMQMAEEKGIQIGEERGIQIGEERGKEQGIQIGEERGEERAEERKRLQLSEFVLRLCHDLNLQLTDEERCKIQQLSFEKLIELQVQIAMQKKLPKSF